MERHDDRLAEIEQEIYDIDRDLIAAESKHHHATRKLHDRKMALITEQWRIAIGTLPLTGDPQNQAVTTEHSAS